MEIKKTLTLEVSERELSIIRSALCRASMKSLMHAQEVEKEAKEKGIENSTAYIHYEYRDEIHKLIDDIDKATEIAGVA
jgi:hypothetical protein